MIVGYKAFVLNFNSNLQRPFIHHQLFLLVIQPEINTADIYQGCCNPTLIVKVFFYLQRPKTTIKCSSKITYLVKYNTKAV